MRAKKAIKSIASTLFLQIVTVISGFIVPSLIIRKYGSEVNGLVTSITQFLGYITLLESGISPVIKAALYKPISSKSKHEIENILKAGERFFRKIAYVFIVYIIILCFVYPLMVQKDFGYFTSFSLILIIAVSTFFEYFIGMVYKIYIQAEQKTYVTSNIQIVTTLLNTLLVVILVNCGSSIQMVKLISAIIFILRPIIQKIYVKKKYNIDLSNADNNYQLKQKWDGLVQHIASVIHNNTDVAILTICSNVKEISVYSVYVMVTSGVKKIPEAIVNSIGPTFGDMMAKKENKLLNKMFELYEFVYYAAITVVFACTITLIVPFIQVYTRGVGDANYYRPTFAYLIVIAEFFWMIRLPYINISYSAGHFKQTRKGAWVEAISNILISLSLVWKFGIIGVAIGTLVAMGIRAMEFIYHTNKYILNRSQIKTILRFIWVVVGVVIIVGISSLISIGEINSYIAFFKYALIIGMISCGVVLVLNGIVFNKDFKQLSDFIKNKIKRSK